MKKNRTRLLAVTAVCALSLALAACGGASGGADDILTKAQEALNDVSSMHYTMDMDIGLTADGEAVEVATTAEADCIVDPMAIEMDMHMDMFGILDMNVKMFMVQDGSSYTVYSGMDYGDGEMTWVKETMDNMDALSQYDGQASMELYLENGSQFKEAGTEDVEGVSATRYDGVITQDSLQAVMEASGMMEQFTTLGIDNAEEMFSEMGDLPVSIWIDPETYLPVKYEMDMTAMMQNMMDKLADEGETADVEVTVDKCMMTMICSDYNGIDTIEIPEEALSAGTASEMTDDFFATEEGELFDEAIDEAA